MQIKKYFNRLSWQFVNVNDLISLSSAKNAKYFPNETNFKNCELNYVISLIFSYFFLSKIIKIV